MSDLFAALMIIATLTGGGGWVFMVWRAAVADARASALRHHDTRDERYAAWVRQQEDRLNP